MLKIGWFTTGRDTAAEKLFEYIYSGIKNKDINAEILFVFSNREEGEFEITDNILNKVSGYGIDVIRISSKSFMPELRKTNIEEWRKRFDTKIIEKISNYEIELIVLAGYMLILSSELCNRYTIINLHPAKPNGPKGSWQEVIHELIRKKEKDTGIMIHLVTEELDAGPVVTYTTYPIVGDKFRWDNVNPDNKETKDYQVLFNTIREEGVKRELPMIYLTIKKISDGEIEIKNKTVYVNGNVTPEGYRIETYPANQ